MNKKYFFVIIVSLFTLFFSLAMPAETLAAQTKKIVIDPGHGGIDSGCTIKGLHEKDITLDISREIRDYLEKKGYRVFMTRNSDVSLYEYCKEGDTIQRRELNARVNAINSSDAGLFVSIHVNSYRRSPDVNGSIVYFYSTECVQSRNLAQCIQKQLNNFNAGGKMRMSHNSRPEDYYILKKTALPGVLVETGFLSNPGERKLFATKGYKKSMAKSIAMGIERYLDNSD